MILFSLLNQSVTLERYIEVDSFTGEEVFADAVTHDARIDYTPDRVLTLNGTEIPSYATVYLAVEVGERDRITLSDGVVRTPKKVSRLYDGRGVFHHSEVSV